MHKNVSFIVFLSFVLQIALIFLFVDGKILLAIGALFGLVFFLYTAFSIDETFLALAFYISALPMLEYLGNFPGMPIGFTWYIAYPLFGLLVIYWIIYLCKNSEVIKFNQMDIAVLIYLCAMSLALINGLFRSYDQKTLLYDFMPASFFLGYFIFIYSPLKHKIKWLYTILLISSILISFQFISAVTKYKSMIVLFRIVSKHIHIAQFAIPFLLLTLIYSQSRRKKIIFSVFLILNILAVFFSQQRALYASTGLSILFLTVIFFYTRRAWIKNNYTKFIFIIGGILTAVIVTIAVLQIITKGKFVITLYSRFFIFLNLNRLSSDSSWQVRWREIKVVLDDLKHFWLFGKGFGVSQVTRFRYVTQITVDNSYVYLIWKTGFVGLFSFLYVYFMFFKHGLIALTKSLTTDERIFVITALVNAAGLMIVAQTNACIATYRFIFVWAALFACTEVIYRKYCVAKS